VLFSGVAALLPNPSAPTVSGSGTTPTIIGTALTSSQLTAVGASAAYYQIIAENITTGAIEFIFDGVSGPTMATATQLQSGIQVPSGLLISSNSYRFAVLAFDASTLLGATRTSESAEASAFTP
jgi:hypothetical protein